MTLVAAKAPAHRWGGADLKLLRSDDYLLAVAGVDAITDNYVRVFFHDGGLLAHQQWQPAIPVRLWFQEGEKRHERTFTVVDPDPVAGVFAAEFALGHDGPAARWAATAAIGDEIPATVTGPGFAVPSPAPHGWLIVGDAASLPAVNSLLGAIAASEYSDVPVSIWMEYRGDDEYALPLRARDDHRVEWVPRGDGTSIIDAVRTDAFIASGYCGWVATEATSAPVIAELLRSRYGLGGAVTGHAYWSEARGRAGRTI